MENETLVLVRDLLFSSRIVATAKAQDVAIKLVRDPAKLLGLPGNRLIVDLNQHGAIEATGQWKQSTGGTVIGFVSHVDVDAIAKAKAAGIDQVMSNGQFTQLLPELLKG